MLYDKITHQWSSRPMSSYPHTCHFKDNTSPLKYGPFFPRLCVIECINIKTSSFRSKAYLMDTTTPKIQLD